MPTRAMSFGSRSCRSPRTPVVSAAHERLQLGGQWAFVRQDPGAGLHGVEVRRLLPGAGIGSAASHGWS